jgi:hypothetical protein
MAYDPLSLETDSGRLLRKNLLKENRILHVGNGQVLG